MNTIQRPDATNVVNWTSQLQSFSRYAADGVIALGFLVILGWIFDIEILKFFFSKLTSMKVNTAFCFILSGTSLRLWHQTLKRQRQATRQLNQVLALSCSLLVISLAVLTLIQDGFSVDLGIDQWLMPQPEPIGSLMTPGRMAPNTAIAFVVVGISLLVQNRLSTLNSTNPNHTNQPTHLLRTHLLVSQGFALIAGAMGFIGLLGHIYGSVYFYTGQSYVRMATHTGIAFMLLSGGIICAKPSQGLIVLLTGKSAGSLVMRRLLPVAIVLPVVVGGASQIGYHLNLYSAEVEAALSSTMNILLLSVLIAWNAHKLNAIDLRRAKIALDLQASQARFAGIVEVASDAIISVDVNQRIILFNRGAEAIFGYSVDEVLGQSLHLLLPDRFTADHDQSSRAFWLTDSYTQSLPERRVQERRELYGRRKDGTEFPADVSISKLELNGEILFTVFLQDITERKQSKEALSRLATIVESSDDAIISKSLDGTILSWNTAAERMFGYTTEEVVGRSFLILIPSEFRDEELQVLERIRQGDRIDSYESIRVRKDNQFINVSVITSSIKDTAGQVIAVSNLERNITQQKQAEASLQESEARFQAFMDNSPAAAWITDINGIILNVNQTYLRTFPIPNTDIIGKSVFDLYPVDFAQRCLNDIQTVAKTGQVLQLNEAVLRSDGVCGDFLVYKFLIPSTTEQCLLGGIALDITERKKLERELQRSEAKLNDILNNVSACIISYRVYSSNPAFLKNDIYIEREWEYEYCSIGSEHVFGYTTDELTARKSLWYERVHPDDWRTVLLPRYQRLFTQQTTTDEYRFQHKDGDWRWISETGSSRWDDNTQSWIVTVVCTDISDRKRVEDTLRQSEATQQAIISGIPDLLIQMKNDGTYVNFISNSEFNIVNPEKIRRDVNVCNLLPEDLAQKRLSYTRQAIHTGKLQTYEQQILVQGRLCHEEVRIVPLDRDEVLVMVRDITARKQAEEQLRKSEAMLREAQRIAQFGSWELDFSTNAMTWSKVLQMVGVDSANSELSYTQFFNCIHPDDRTQFQQHFDRAIDNGIPYETDLRVVKPDGTIGYLEVRGKPLYNEQGQIIKLFGTALDVTERKHIELELQQAKDIAEAASQAKSMFLASISHELRTPLNVILGFTQVLHRDTSLSAEQQETIQIIHRSGEHLLNLINDILDLSKIEAGHITLEQSDVDLPNLLQSIMDMLRYRAISKGLTFQCDMASEIPQYITTDVNKLRQILINLLSNAIKFTEKGHITLRVQMEWNRDDREDETSKEDSREDSKDSRENRDDRNTQMSRFSSSSSFLVFDVEDTGMGIAENEIDVIFDAFVQSRVGKITPGGTGLGLTISHRFAELMGGTLSVQSVLGQGSVFTIRIPIQLAEAADISLFSPSRQIVGLVPGQPTYRVLAVDDQLENRQLLVKLMQELGLEVRQATNGQEAVTLWQQWHPHLIWMDIWMPMMDGYEATRQIRSLEATSTPGQRVFSPACSSQTIIIALTAHASRADRTQALASGCNDLITKPVHENWLYDKMTEYLGLKFLYAAPSSIGHQRASGLSFDRYNTQYTMPDHVSEYFPEHSDEYFSEYLQDMPTSWIANLYHAAQICDEEEVEHLVQQIPDSHQALADHLNYLAHEYQFEQIQQIVLHTTTDSSFSPDQEKTE